ncbi:hypothetical protein [Comamonas sp. MYb396]|uniref:hypothetical protein n=1 Tax=Comamonas sp. MYb396 TaxID=2745302 RepID=UPI0030DCB040
MRKFKSQKNTLTASVRSDNCKFLMNFSSRTRNALAGEGIQNQEAIDEWIESGKIFAMPKLGLCGLREVIIWSWRNRA